MNEEQEFVKEILINPMKYELTFKPKQKEFVRKCAPNLANALFDEDNKEDRAFIHELEIRSAIKRAYMGGSHEDYIGIPKIAQAIKDGFGEDLLPLIKSLCKLCSKTKSRGKK